MNLCWSSNTSSSKMRRTVLHSENRERNEHENIDTTPLRRSSNRFPRLRLLHKDFKSEEVPRCPSGNFQSAVSKPAKSQTVKAYPRVTPRQACSADRFISRRCEYNVEAANYLLTKKVSNSLDKNELDIFKQVDSLTVTWRKKFMHQLMVKENVIPGVRQKQVLRSSQSATENKLPGNLAGKFKDLWDEECFEDGMWKSKPRKRPLIGIMDSIVDMTGLQPLPRLRFRIIDWSSTNLIAAVIQDAVTFYDTNLSQTVESLALENVNTCTLKWSNAGDKLLICTMSSNLSLYDVVKQKTVWTSVCKCLAVYNTPCFVRCVCFSFNDQHIVTGCRGILTVYLTKTGSVLTTLLVHNEGILTMSFSLNYRYLVVTAPDTSVRIFLWPSLISFLEISYYQSVKAVAWHPHESGLLCIGGGSGDASLSLWNVNRLDPLTYRRVQFYGAVEDLAWNKISGELVVHWSCWEARNRYTIVPILASLDRVVDVVPIERESRLNCIFWNSDHTQFATQSGESLSIWNFFGDEYQAHRNYETIKKPKKVRNGITINSFEEFRYFNIR